MLILFSSSKSFAASPWEILNTLHPASSKPNSQIKELLTKPVEISGYTIVDEFKDEEISEFLLTQQHGSCIHDPLPSPNNLIHVIMPAGKTLPAYVGQKLVVHGTIKMSTRSDCAYEIQADSVQQL